jgi:hypothetical protein
MKHNRPVAAIVPIEHETTELWGALRGTVIISPGAVATAPSGEVPKAQAFGYYRHTRPRADRLRGSGPRQDYRLLARVPYCSLIPCGRISPSGYGVNPVSLAVAA